MKPRIHIPDIADSGRRAYRLQIDDDAPLQVQVNDETVRVDNLSATGLAFTTETLLTLQYYPVRLEFTTGTQVHQLNCTLRLIRNSGSLWCGDFSNLDARQQRQLSEFISWYQTEQIRNKDKKV